MCNFSKLEVEAIRLSRAGKKGLLKAIHLEALIPTVLPDQNFFNLK